MLKIAICDDDQIFLQQLHTQLVSWMNSNEPSQIICFHDGDSLIHAHTRDPFDIIFLDILMPMLNGIETAGELRSLDKNVKIVFLTSSPEFAVDSYTVKASNYLLKPLNKDKLLFCLNELLMEIRASSAHLLVKGINATHRISLENIEFLEAQNKHVMFSLADGQTIFSTEPLYVYEKQLLISDGFFRCHRSYIVNIYLIHTYTSKEITMCSGLHIPISRSCQKEFEEAYFSALFGRAGE